MTVENLKSRQGQGREQGGKRAGREERRTTDREDRREGDKEKYIAGTSRRGEGHWAWGKEPGIKWHATGRGRGEEGGVGKWVGNQAYNGGPTRPGISFPANETFGDAAA